MAQQQAKSNTGQVVTLVVIAVILAAGYIALDFYSAGEKNKAITESRGTQIVQALSKHRLEAKAYPDSLDKLVPKFAQALPKCPGGERRGVHAELPERGVQDQAVRLRLKVAQLAGLTR